MSYIKYFIYLIVFIVFTPANAGSYDDFFEALRADDVPRISRVLARGFDPNTLSPEGQYPLILAIRRPSPAVLGVLLGHPGLRVEVRNAKDESPLMLASLSGMVEVSKRLIARDADVNKTGWTPLHYAASRGHVELVRLLLSHSAYIDAESPNKSTPLMMAAMYGNPQTVALLLAEGADVTLKNDKGLHALDFAVAGGMEASAKLLAPYFQASTTP